MPWLIGGLAAVALLGLGYALLDLAWRVTERIRALGQPGRGHGVRVLQQTYGLAAPGLAEPLLLPASVRATLAVLRRPSLLMLLPLGGGLLLAGLASDVWISPYLTLLGAAVTLYLAYRQTLHARQGISDEVRRLVDAFIGLYRVNPTTFTTLALAAEHVSPGLVRDEVRAAVRHYEATRDTHAALQKLLTVRDAYLMRFVLVLDQAGEQGPTEISRLIEDLQARLRRRWTTRLAAQGVFAAIRSTLIVLVGAAAAVTGVGVTIPLWRGIHLDSTGSRALFMALTSVAFVAAAYFDRRMRLDEETLL